MENLLQQFVFIIQNFVNSNNIFLSIFFGMGAIVLESVIPPLPLGLFITINIIAFGNILGFIICYIATIIGCTASFFLCKKIEKEIRKYLKKENKILNFIKRVDKIKFSNLCLLMSMPFTPAFAVNIAAGLSGMQYKKYLMALIISKLFIVYFWGYVGSNIIFNITNIPLMIMLGIMVLTIYILSKIVVKKFNL